MNITSTLQAMTRRKVKLAFIVNDAEQKSTYNKRRKGLMKKLKELTTLCDIDACAILYSPYDPENPEVWPNPLDVHRVLSYFKTMPKMDQSKKMLNQESFLKERIAKARDQLKKQGKENREMEARNIIAEVFTGRSSVENFMLEELCDVSCVIEQRQKEVDFRLKGIADYEDEVIKGYRAIDEMQKSVEALRIQQQPLFMDLLNGVAASAVTAEAMVETDEVDMGFGGDELMLHFAGDDRMWANAGGADDNGGSFKFIA